MVSFGCREEINMKTNNQILLIVLLITALACSMTGISTTEVPVSLPVSATAPPTIASTFTPISTFTPAPPTNLPPTPMLSQTVSMQSTPFSETGESPVYTITAQIPNLQSSADSRVGIFNELMKQIVQEEITQFKNDVLAFATNPSISAGSSFDLKYSIIGQRADIWSIKFDISVYADGAAHPYGYSRTLNYDLSNGREITLSELFLSSSNYLQVISNYCKSQLSSRDIAFDSNQQGADPLSENYQRWNISDEGLVITFDAYQVAAYAAGPQLVAIPFSALQSISNPQGALGLFAQ
jgi:hypothetical protein